MKNYLKASEAPKTKLRLKKAILNGSILVYECNMNNDNKYTLLENINTIIKLWEGFHYNLAGNEEAKAYLGTSFNYKFANA